jgi:DNA-binding CsgD family transcriptional regulator
MMTAKGRLVLRGLTKRERRILVLVCAGVTNKTIAVRMNTGEQVIKNRLGEILSKADCLRRSQLIVWRLANGVVSCPCADQYKEERSVAPMFSPEAPTDQAACNRRLSGRITCESRST